MKKTYNTGVIIIIITTLFWLTYTIAYLFIDGWHWKAISPTEKSLDFITTTGWRIGLTLWFIAVARLVDRIFTVVIK